MCYDISREINEAKEEGRLEALKEELKFLEGIKKKAIKEKRSITFEEINHRIKELRKCCNK